MLKTKRKCRDGEVIFRESEVSSSVFVVVEGNVELTKTGDRGPVMLAMLPPGEMFGEMGILDGSVRSATATAVGQVVLEETTRQDLLAAIKSEPEMALEIMQKLVARLRRANEMLAHPSTVEKSERSSSSGSSLLGGILRRLIGGGGGERIEIRVAPLIGEVPEFAADQTRHLIARLGKRRGIHVRQQSKLPPLDPDMHPDDRVMIFTENARQAMTQSGGDLMIWGEIPPPGTTLHLRFVSKVVEDDDRPGGFMAMTTLTLPVDFEADLSEMLLAVALAATAPSAGNRVALAQALSEALYAAMPAVQNLPHDLTSRERFAIQMCYANAVAAMAGQRGTVDLYRVAEQTYRAALTLISSDEAPFDWAMTQKHLGAVLQAIAERTNETDMLSGAADAFVKAIEILGRDQYPLIWAAIQNRLGLVLYRLDLKTSDTEMLKHSLSAFQAALQVFTRTEHPLRWAEVMNNFAQAASVLGEQMHSAEALRKAADACLGALDVRRRDREPLLWAQTQNNLGSALFLLGKLNDDEADLNGAAGAFGGAIEVYRSLGAARLAQVAEKNLSHVRNYLDELAAPQQRSRPGQQIPTLHWEEADDDGKPVKAADKAAGN